MRLRNLQRGVRLAKPIRFYNPGGPKYTIEYLVVAGGGSGNNGYMGAGGGEALQGSLVLKKGASLTVVIGAGGVGSLAGTASTLGALTARPGMGGSSPTNPGYCGNGTPSGAGRGGGGGNATKGMDGLTAAAPNGGNGIASTITGTSIYYGGGGGGGSGHTSGYYNGSPGLGGGSTANRGGGASSGAGGGVQPGGSGIAIIRYPGTQVLTGGTVTSVGGYTIHTFTSSGTLAA